MNIFGNKGTININGSSYSGSNVSIVNGIVTVDGVVQKQQIRQKNINHNKIIVIILFTCWVLHVMDYSLEVVANCLTLWLQL